MALWHIPIIHKGHPLDNIFDDTFDWSLFPRHFRLLSSPYRRVHNKPYSRRGKGQEDTFKVTLDVNNYQPEDISLKVDGDKLLVKGKRYKESEFGFESSEFERIYPIPSDVDTKGFQSKLNDEGLLEIEAPRLNHKAIHQDENKYKAVIDVSRFKPDEVSVKVQGNQVIIHGDQKSEIKEGGKPVFVHHIQFKRQIVLPDTVKLDSLQSKWTKDGNLVIEADKCPALEEEVTRQLEIEYEGEGEKMDE